MQHLLAIVALLLGLSAFGAPQAAGGELLDGEAAAVRAVIQAQLEAFAADDAAKAFSYAAPAIQRMFIEPHKFIAMVRSAYPVVWRPASVNFGRMEWDEKEVVQAVRMSDAKGGVWLVLYRMELQPDKLWRIAGCEIVRAPGRSV